MGPHKYSVGHACCLRGFPDIRRDGRFRVARLHPLEGLAPQYWVKSEFDGHERIVREGHLTALADL
jgi:hypothetical protein